MKINFNRKGAERKALVTAMGEILQAEPKYLGMPSANYKVGCFTIDKNGTVEFDDSADSEEIENLLDRLAERGFLGEMQDEAAGEKEISQQRECVGLTVVMPLDKVSVGNLTRLLDAKGSLIRKALGIDATPLEISEDAVSFPWFSEMPDADTVQVYTHFISALCRMSTERKRVTMTVKDAGSEKYAFRCFLLRLGFIGAEYKAERKILLKNLAGSSAYRNGGAGDEISR